jgi:hypothetical protein
VNTPVINSKIKESKEIRFMNWFLIKYPISFKIFYNYQKIVWNLDR